MERFRGRLYVGIQDYDGKDPNDYLVWTPAEGPAPKDANDAGSKSAMEARVAEGRRTLHAVRATEYGAGATVRWYVDPITHRLYWITWARDGILLRATDDGDTWRVISLPADGGHPTDIMRFGPALVVLTERALYTLDDAGKTTEIVKIADKKSPFELTDFMCGAPLAEYKGALYAGGQRGGSLYRLDADVLRSKL
jgi:hypothetical protein